MTIDALLPGGRKPRWLWGTHFAGVAFPAATKVTNYFWYRDVNGTDSLTGKNFTTDLQSAFGPTATARVYSNVLAACTTEAQLDARITNTIGAASGFSGLPAGAGMLTLDLLTTTTANTEQTYLYLQRSSGSAISHDVREFYTSFDFILPSGLAIDTLGEFRTIWEIKTGAGDAIKMAAVVSGANRTGSSCASSTADAGDGDFRIWVACTGANSTTNELMVRIDDGADNGGIVPSAYWDATGFHVTGADPTKYIFRSGYTGISCPLNVQLRLHVYYKAPPTPLYTDRARGVLQVLLENISDGTFYELCDIRNSLNYQLSGSYNLPFTRFFIPMCYGTQASAPIKVANLHFWDTTPIRIFNTPSYNRAAFYAPFAGSLALTNGTGSATFTRATAAWEFNHIGKLVSIPSDAVRMRGYRPVVNRITSSEGAYAAHSGASSSTGNVDVPSGKDCTTSTKLVEDTSIAANHLGYRTVSVLMLGTYKVRQYFKGAGRTKLQIYGGGTFPFQSGTNATVDLSTGSVTGTASAYVTATVLSDGWVEVISTHVPTATGSNTLYTRLLDGSGSSTYTGDGTSGVLNTGVMAVNITPNALTTVPEYVSVGVLSSPWHGAGADGVKYFSTYEDGTAIPEANLRGVGINPNQVINTLLYCRDLTNAAWVKTNVTAALTQTGIDEQANACSLVEFTADGGTVLQTITAAAAAGCSGYYVKRHTGTGTVEFTRDNVTWTDITRLINSTSFTLVKIENTSVTNPVIGFRGQSGDKIIVDAGMNHLGAKLASYPIITTSAAVTVNAETLTYPTSGNIRDAAGTLLATFTADSYSSGMGNIVGSATVGLATSSSYMCQAKDETNTVNGSVASPSGTIKIGMAWDANLNTMYAIGENGVEASGSYDDSLGLSTIAILPSVDGYVKDVAIFNKDLSDGEITDVFNS